MKRRKDTTTDVVEPEVVSEEDELSAVTDAEIVEDAEVADAEVSDADADADDESEAGQKSGLPAVVSDKGEDDSGETDAKTSGALVPSDNLARYMAEIRRHALLSPEEEHELAVRWQEEGDREAAAQLVTANLRLVVMIARQYQRAFRNLLDLVQEGNVGLLEAVKNFDPYRGVRFPSYAVYWIRAYVIRHVMNNWRMVKIGTTQAQRKLFFNLQREKERLEREGFRPDPELIADRLSVKPSEVVEMEQRMSGRDVSVDAPVGEDNDAPLLDFVSSTTSDAEARVGDRQVLALVGEKMREFGEDLADKERVIFEERMMAEEPLTLQEIGERFGVTRERVRQIEERIKKRLREFLVREVPDISDVDVRMSLEESKKS